MCLVASATILSGGKGMLSFSNYSRQGHTLGRQQVNEAGMKSASINLCFSTW